MVVSACVEERSVGLRVEKDALPHRILPVIASEEKPVAFNAVLGVREDLDSEASAGRIAGENRPFEGPRIVVIDRHTLDGDIGRLLDGERHHAPVEHEVGAVAFDRDIPHVLDQEGYALVTAVVVRERQELPRPLLRIERVKPLPETNPHITFRM